MKPFRVLALDGGGMRGLYSATVLESFAKHYAARRGLTAIDVGKGFDLIVGTSTGGILACGLAHGLTPTQIATLFRQVGPLLFRRPIPDSGIGLARWILGTLLRSANSDEQLRQALDAAFGNTTLGDLFDRRGIALCIPAVNISTGRSLVFKTPHDERLVRDRRFRLTDVCMSTSAAPIYLPLATVDDPDDAEHPLFFIDGGLWANNPVLIGLVEALAIAAPKQPIQILSVSTCPLGEGALPTALKRHWGLLQWKGGTTALTMALESQSSGYHYMACRLAETLRRQGRECHVIRVPHTSPAKNLAGFVALDRASPESLRILADLGRQDGDVESAATHWGGGEATSVVADIFLTMPPLTPSAAAIADERRAAPRISHNVLLTPGLVLRDESATGASVTIHGPRPAPGEVFSFPTGNGVITGTVRWAREVQRGMAVIGIAKEPTATSQEPLAL